MPSRTGVPPAPEAEALTGLTGHTAANTPAPRPDFHLFTAALEPNGETPDGLQRVRAIGSSTIQDLQGDTMELSALQDMTEAPPKLLIFLNHDYDVPEDVAGHLNASPAIQVQNGIGDLLLDIALYTYKPRIASVYKDIQAGGRHGVSIGCMVTEAEWRATDGTLIDQDKIDFWDIIEGNVLLHITGVLPLEWSIVGIPANQRSWVQQAARGLFERSLATTTPDDASDAAALDKRLSLLAPLVRAWWPNNYASLVRGGGITDQGRLKTLLDIPARKGRAQVLWTPGAAKSEQAWSLNSGQRAAKRTQALTRAQVESLLQTEFARQLSVSGPQETDSLDTTLDTTDTLVADDTIVEKSASGKADWPLAARDRAWDNGEAHERLVEWAGGKDDLDVAKFASVHFWSPTGDEKSDVSKYKLAFCDIIGGDVKAIPRGIFACAGAHGVDAADIPDADKAKVKTRIEGYYKRMAEEFDDDTIVAPWLKDDRQESQESLEGKGAESDMEKTVSGTGGDLTVKADGSHDAYTGEHEHHHPAYGSQGGDATHKHPHSHDGDANHEHHAADGAADGKSVEPLAPADELADAANRQIELARAENAGEASASASALVTASVASVEPDPARAALLKTYQDMLTPLGFTVREASDVPAAAAPVTTKAAWSDDEEQGIRAGIAAIDNQVDSLMRLAGIPDDDTWGGDGDGGSGESKGMLHLVQRVLGLGLALKDGRRHSAADRESIQAIHEACKSLTDGDCCKAATDDGAGQSSSTDTPTDAGTDTGGPAPDANTVVSAGLASLTGITTLAASSAEWLTGLGALTEALGAVKGVSAHLAEAEARAAALADLVKGYTAQAEGYEAQVAQMAAHVAKLREMPLPRPTQMQRSVTPASSTATDPALARYEDFFPDYRRALAIPASDAAPELPALSDAERSASLASALAQTNLVTRQTDGLECRQWPAGVGAGVRPPLTNDQRARMTLQEWSAYDSGGAALVPTLGAQ